MAIKKISELTAGVTPTGAEMIPVVQSGTTVRLTHNQIAQGLQKGYGDKYIIQFGKEPSTSSFATNIKLYEQWELDGMVVVPTFTDPVYGASTNASWRVCTSYPLKWSLFATALSDLQGAYSSKLIHNFLRVNTCPAGDSGVGNPGDRLDIFDWNSVKIWLGNMKLLARLAREARFKGIFLDTERYNTSGLFDFSKARSSKSFSEYQAQIYKLGIDLMYELQDAFNGITLITTLGYEQLANGSTTLSSNVYGLLPKFLDGLHDGCGDGNVIVNGCEATYFNAGGGTDSDMIDYYKTWQEDTTNMSNLGRVLGSSKYLRTHETAFSIWLDADSDSGHPTFDYSSPWTNNFWTPTTFQAAILKRLQSTKRYIWIYNSIPRWTGYTVGVNKVPYQYGVDALKGARVSVGIDVAYDPKLFGTKGCCRWLWDPTAAGLSDNDVPATLSNQNGTSEHFTQSTSGKRMTYKATAMNAGLGSLLATAASSQCYSSTALAAYFTGADKPITAVFVLKMDTVANGSPYTAWALGRAGANTCLAGVANSVSQKWITRRIDDSGSSSQYTSAPYNSGDLGTATNIIVWRSTGTIAEISVNGNVSVVAAAQDVGTMTLDNMFIGAKYINSTESEYWNNYIVPYAIFSEFIEDGQVLQMCRYLGKLCSIEID